MGCLAFTPLTRSPFTVRRNAHIGPPGTFPMTDHSLSPSLALRPHALRGLDVRLFRLLGCGSTERPLTLAVAVWIAHWSWVPLVGALAMALWRGPAAVVPVLGALGAATALQVLAKRLARWVAAPRPFAVGLCANHLNHSLRGGMPSTHAAVMGCLAGALSPWMVMWPELALVPAIAALTGWARVHAGAHFPSDVLVGLALGGALGRQAMAAVG